MYTDVNSVNEGLVSKINIGITCVGSLISQGVIKSIQKSDLGGGTTLIGFEYFEGTVGSYWVDKTYIMPDILKPEITHGNYVAELVRHIKTHGIKILFIGMDFELPLFASRKESIFKETGCVVIVSSPWLIDIAEDKYKTFLFLQKNNLPRPLTWLPAEFEDVVLPAIVKPRRGERSKGVRSVNSAAELRLAVDSTDDAMIQEEVGTKDEEYTCAVIYLDGVMRSCICMRRYLRDGNTNIAIHSPENPPGLMDYIEKLSNLAKPFGAVNFQLRIDRHGVPKLFEINARFSGTTAIRTLFGLNEVEYIIKYILGMKLPECEMRYGKVLRYTEEMFVEDVQ